MKSQICLLLSLFGLINGLSAQDRNKQKNVNSIFDAMELEGVDTKKPLLYGYFFFDKDKSKLEKLKEKLLKDNYKLVRLEQTENKQYILHIEKVEMHSRASLLERDEQFAKLSKEFKISIYDGWDVGNADPKKPLTSNEDFMKSLENKSESELFKIACDLYDREIKNKAVIAFQLCIDKKYKLDTCNFKQGVSYLGLGQTNVGIEKLEEAIKINPNYFKAYFNIGAACYEIEEYTKSITYYKKAAELSPTDDRIYYGIAANQFVLGQLKDAEANCEIALKFNPANDNAKNLLESLQKKH